jgi:hypothetical protein
MPKPSDLKKVVQNKYDREQAAKLTPALREQLEQAWDTTKTETTEESIPA